MDNKSYNVAVLKTESKPETINFGTIGTHAVLGLIYATGEMVDVAKKSMFYGKAFDRFKFAQSAAELADLANTLRQQALDNELCDPNDIKAFGDLPPNLAGLDLNDSLNKRLLHVVMGTSSESSEIANELRLAWEEKRPVDRVNMSEEIGDHFWYLAVGADELGVPLSVIFQQNITKLNDKKTGRYRQGAFDMNSAINRELDAERATLEQAIDGPVNETQPGQKIPVVYGGAAAYRNALVATPTSDVFYDPNDQLFVWFNEAALEGGRVPDYQWACAQLRFYYDRLNNPGRPSVIPQVVVQVEGANAGQLTDSQAAHLANLHPGQTSSLERFGAAAKTVAGKALDAVDTGVDKAKAYLGRQ